jgi:hypothetical protein
MHQKTPKASIVDGTVLSSSPAPQGAPARKKKPEKEEAKQEIPPPPPAKHHADPVPPEKQQASGHVRFEKWAQKQRQVPQRANEEITSFDLHPIEEEREDEHERAP